MKTTIEHLATLNPQKSSLFITFLNRVKKELGWSVIITTSYRDFLEQEELKQKNKKNAEPGMSSHNYGFAIDVNFIKGNGKDFKQLKKDSIKSEWEDSGIIKIAKECGLRWGGDFLGYYDPIHFDCITPDCTHRWLKYLKKTYPDTYKTKQCNLINWKF